jgi:fibronectin type 3 domain-containing protein
MSVAVVQTAMPAQTATISPPAAAPAPVTATPGDGSVLLQWPSVDGATFYRVFRKAGDVWDTRSLARVTATSYRNSGLVNGTSYTYRVAAYNDGGSGPVSADVTAMALAAPSGVVATAGDTQVALTWSASAGASSYTVYRGASSTASTMVAVASGVAATSFGDTGLTNGTVYYYRVRGVSGDNLSPFSASVSAKPLPPPPSASPGNFTATAGNAVVVLNWSAVEGAVGYRIFRATAGVWDTAPIASTSRTTYRNTGLTNDTAYTYKIAAYNIGGNGPLSTEASATPLLPPPAPTDLGANAGDAQVTLTWTAAPGAASYSVYRGTTSARKTRLTAPITAPPFVDTGLANGTRYFYQVTAVNGGGESPRSDEVIADPEGPPLLSDPETIAAFRLLRQATWGPRPGDVDALKSGGADAFLASQFGAPVSAYPSTLLTMPVEAAQEHFMSLALTGPDQLRQRVAWALHKIWVVSAVEVPSARAIVTYQRLLMDGAFGNYRDVMRNITLNPAMGRYLNMLNSRS